MDNRIIQAISNIFHPLLSLTWVTVLLVIFSPLQHLQFANRFMLVGEVALMSFVLPCLVIILLSKLGIVKNGVALRDRKDRVIPLSFYMIFCFIQAHVLKSQELPEWAMIIYWGGAYLSVIFVIVTFWWKISGHAAGNSCLATAVLLLLYIFPNYIPLILPILLIILAGGVSSIRLYLGRHTPAQIAAGTLAGALSMLIAFCTL